MGRKEKTNAKAIITEHEQDNFNGASTPSIVFSSDDDEANQDLSLKIVEKALRKRVAKHAPNDGVLNAPGGVVSFSRKPELAVAPNDGVWVGPGAVADSEVTEKKKTTKLKAEAGDQSVVVIAEEQEMVETVKATENDESVEGSTVQISDNMVLRKLLRGPRYFDPPDSSWGACFNCGEEGHTAVNCSAAKRKKPCYVCGGFGHNAKQCTNAQDCFICKKGGHRAKIVRRSTQVLLKVLRFA
ncbi:Gag polyprotein [Spatholobus suberectus]|nr:Gag polyprotein [Spatholobus suberectus]